MFRRWIAARKWVPVLLAPWAWFCLVGTACVAAELTRCGRLTTDPETPLSARLALADGNTRSGIAFPVGSTGAGTVCLTFLRSRTVTGLRFHQNSEIYFCTRVAVRGDSDGDGTFETTLAESEATPPPGWTDISWPEASVKGICLVALDGVSKGRRAHPCLSEFVVLGDPLPTDAADAREAGWPITDLDAARPLDRWIDLSGRQRPVGVVHPDTPAAAAAAEQLASALRERGAQRVVVDTDAGDLLPTSHTVVALGNVNTNALVARLYWNRYAYEDGLVPGPGGWSLRTVYDPYPWHGQGDIIVVGYSRDDDVEGAVSAFVRALDAQEQPLGMDYALQVSTAPPPADAVLQRLSEPPDPSFKVFADAAETYLRTGQDVYARHALAALDAIVKDQREKGESYDCDWPEETSSGRILALWDAFDECDIISEEKRLAYERAVLRFMRTLQRHVSGYAGLGRNDLVTWNHTTFPLLGLYFGSRYFHDYYGVSECARHLAKADACFLAQARSWKPQEDADSYITLTMNHTIDYCLAEWRTELLEDTEIITRFADYVIGFCDSAGLAAGFGDSGLHAAPSLLPRALPRAFAWTGDASYLWVLRHTQGTGYQSPFHPDAEPEPPGEYVGVRTFPLDPQLYEFTRTRPFYNEPVSPPNVSPEEAFDKVAFRESWDPDGQYVLLDGYARGKHLHYDGNAIIEFVDGGRRWLIDHDYLTRNTTEHNMLSVLRNGRADELVPSCAALTHRADLGGRVGLVSTEMRDYLGVDWQRRLFWLKGEYLAVLDIVTAREANHFDLDMVWKVADQGEQVLENTGTSGGEFRVVRRDACGERRGVTKIADEEASGGGAVVLGESGAEYSFVADLPAGAHDVVVYAYGRDGSSDSLFVSVDGGQPVACHLPKDAYGPSNSRFDLSGDPATVDVTTPGEHVVSLRLRERPPVRVDRIAFRGKDGRTVLEVEAERAVSPGPAQLAALPADRFYVRWDDPSRVRTWQSQPKGIVVPVRKLIQRQSGRLGPGDTREFGNLLFCRPAGETRDYTIRRLSPGAVLVGGDETALLAVAGAEVPGLAFDAAMLSLSPRQIAWCDGTRLGFGETRLVCPDSRSLEIALDGTAGSPISDSVCEQLTSEAVQAFLSQLQQGLAPGSSTGEGTSAAISEPVWRLDVERPPVRRLRVRDLDGDNREELLVAAGSSVLALTQGGNRHWRFDLASSCMDVAAGELHESDGIEVVTGDSDGTLYLLSAGGDLLSTEEIRGPAWNQKFGDRAWGCSSLEVVDLHDDGTSNIVVGTQSMELRLYSPSWKMIAMIRKSVLHGSLDFFTRDLNDDGVRELLATNRYGSVTVHAADGEQLGRFYTSIGDMQAVADDVDGDGRIELVAGSSTGDLVCWSLSDSGSVQAADKRWCFDNFGYGVNRLKSRDLDADGVPEVLLASQTGYVYALNGDGTVRWQRRVGSDIGEVCPRPNGGLACVDRDGRVALLTQDGALVDQFDVRMHPRHAIIWRDRLILAGDGAIAAYELP